MCGDAIRDSFKDSASSFVGGNPSPDNVTTLDDGDVPKPQNRLEELKDVEYLRMPSSVILDDYANDSFETVHNKLPGSSPAGHKYIWGSINDNIVEATQKFRLDLAALKSRDGRDGWKGATRDAAIQNIALSLKEPAVAGGGAGVMEILVDVYAKMLDSMITNINGNWVNYQNDLKAYPEFQDQVKSEYNNFAQKVMRDIYHPSLVEIAKNNPAFTDGGPQQLGGGPGGPGPLGGGPGGPGSLGGPRIPDFGGPTMPEIPTPAPIDPSTVPASPDPAPTDPMRAASDAAKNAADTANQAAGGAQNAGQRRPPEGVLGLGPKGLGGAGAGKGSAGAGKSGAGAGVKPPRGLASGRTAGAPAAPAAKLGTPTRAATAGAGLGAMGPPGAAPPAAGQRGGENNAHTASKALRRKKNGQNVAGEAEAVVPVIGAPEKRPMVEGTRPDEADKSDQPDRGAEGVRAAPWAARGAEHVRSSV